MPVRRIVILLATAAALVWLAVHYIASDSISVVRPVTGRAVQAVYATGTVEGTVMLPLAAKASARLVELNADEGDAVTKDQILARLENDALRERVRELEARARYAKSRFERNAELFARRIISRDVFDQSEAEHLAASAAFESAKAEADYFVLVSPDDGLVIRRDGEIGELIAADEPVFWIRCCGPLRITAEVDEEDIPLVEPGQKVLIQADAFPGRTFDGRVRSITPKGDPVARSYRVRVAIEGDTPLLIGMTGEINIIVRETESAILLPSNAVLKDRVWIVTDGRLESRRVTVGARGAERTEIVSGIGPEDLVVLNPDEAMAAGRQVRVRLED